MSCLISSAYGEESVGSVSFPMESIDHGSVSSVGVSSNIFELGYVGISLNHITSSIPIQIGNRTSIAPFYFFACQTRPGNIFRMLKWVRT